jgi:hypothetical protein
MKRLGIGLAILIAVLLIINGAYSWYTGRQLEQRLAKLRAAGEPTTFAELAPKPIPSEQDAAVHLQRLAPRLKAFEKEYVEFFDRTPLGKSFSEREEQGKPPTSEQIVAIREILSRYPELPQAIDEASRREGYASQIDYTVADSHVIEEVMSTASGRRTPARFLRWKIRVLLDDGKRDEALRMGLVILRLARHYDGEPALVNGLVACGVRYAAVDSLNLVLCSEPLSPEVRQQLDQELALHDDPAWIQHVMKTERVINLSASRSQFSEAWWLPWYERGLEIDMIDFHQRLLPAISQPWYKARNGIRNINTGAFSYSTPVSGASLALLEPAIESAGVSFNLNTAMLRCLRIRNSLTAYAQDNGHEAEGFDDVDLAAAAILDPFSGKPLRLKWTDEGWVVYTVFMNGTDDGGDFKDQADWGLGPAGYVP